MARFFLLLAVALTLTSSALGDFGDVVSSFDLPSELAGADGLTWDGGYLWACHDMGTSFYQLNTVGSLLSSFRITPAPYANFEGAAFDGGYLWCSERYFRPPPGMVIFHQLTTTGSQVTYFQNFAPAPLDFAGMCYAGGYLWADGYKYTTAGSLVSSFTPPFPLTDLAWDGTYLWSGNQQITTAGSAVASFDLPQDILLGGGTTFDGEYLWLVGSDRLVYQVDIGLSDAGGGGGSPDTGSYNKVKRLYR
jgi:hypothetical protein